MASSQKLNLQAKGLYLYQNEFSEVPEGALQVASDVEIKREGVIESRRGFDYLSGAFTSASDRANQLIDFQDYLLAHYGTNALAYYDTATNTWTDYTDGVLPADTTLGRLKYLKANNNLYLLTSTGVKKLEAYNSQLVNAGIPRALGGTAALSGTTGFLQGGQNIAYRILWGIKDANNNLILGSPSGRITIENTYPDTIYRDVVVTATIPSGITTSHFYQLYRSSQFDSGVNPDDELQLVFEGNPTSGELTAQSVSITDQTPDDLLGATIYIANSQEGIQKSNEEPPFAKTGDVFKGYSFLGNILSKYRLYLTLLSVGTTGDKTLQTGDTLTIAGQTYTAVGDKVVNGSFGTNATWTFGAGWSHDTNKATHASGTAALEQDISVVKDDVVHIFFDMSGYSAGSVAVSCGGATDSVAYASDDTFNLRVTATGTANLKFTPTTDFVGSIDNVYAFVENADAQRFALYTNGSVSQNIADTSESLCRVINGDNANTLVYAYYLSGVDELPGEFLIEERGSGGSVFTAVASAHGAAFSPSIASAESATRDVFKNGLAFSKLQQPEAYPLLNYYLVGSSSEEILSVKASRDSLFIFKTDGIYRLTGYTEADFRIEQFDATSVLLAPDTVVNLNNQIYMLSTQGVCSVSDTGVSVLSRNIENVLLELFGADISGVKQYSFAIGYETDRKYCLFLISKASQTAPTQAYVYNFFTNCWTKWVMQKTCGLVFSSNDKLYLGSGITARVSKERKSFTYTDFIDENIVGGVTIISHVGGNVTLDSSAGITVGDLLYESASKWGVVTAISAGNTVTVSPTPTFSDSAAANIYKGINCQIEWNNETAGNLYQNKQWREIVLQFKNSFFVSAKVGFSSNLSRTVEFVTLSGDGLGGWGADPWGTTPWGGVAYSKPLRTLVVRDKQRASWIKVQFICRNAYSKFLIDGIGYTFNPMNERIVK